MSGKNLNAENSLSTVALMLQIGMNVDVTFAAFPASEAEELAYCMAPSTPHDPSAAILTEIRTIRAIQEIVVWKYELPDVDSCIPQWSTGQSGYFHRKETVWDVFKFSIENEWLPKYRKISMKSLIFM